MKHFLVRNYKLSEVVAYHLRFDLYRDKLFSAVYVDSETRHEWEDHHVPGMGFHRRTDLAFLSGFYVLEKLPFLLGYSSIQGSPLA